MRIAYMGTPDFAVPALEALASAHEVAAVYTQPPRPAGRGQKPRPSPVALAAERLGLEVRDPVSLKGTDIQEAFAALRLDAAVVAAYGLILPKAILDAPRFGCLNIHASLLPRWRGAAPIHRAIMAGDAETGVCVMQMEEGLDTGPVHLREATPIGPEDTTGDLHDRLASMGARLVLDALEGLPGDPEPQEGEPLYAAKIDKAEARVDWTRPASEVARHVNGLSPFPGAWTMRGETRLKLLRARPVDTAGHPGEHLGGLCIACGDGAVEILEIQPQGSRPMPPAAFLNGASFPPAERLL